MQNYYNTWQDVLFPNGEPVCKKTIFTKADFRRAAHSARYEIIDITGMTYDQACQEIFILAYDSILAAQDVRTRQERLKRTLVNKGLVSPDAMIENRGVLSEILWGAHRGKSKVNFILSLSNYWLNSEVNGRTIDERIIEDVKSERKHANELRNEIANNVMGMKDKTTNYFFSRLGYPDNRVLDVHITRFVKEYGHLVDRDTSWIDSKAGLHGAAYEKAGEIFIELANHYGIDPDLLSLLVWNSKSPYADRFISLMEQTGIDGKARFEYSERRQKKPKQSTLDDYISQAKLLS